MSYMSKLQTARNLWKIDKFSIVHPLFVKLNKMGLLNWMPSAMYLKIDFRLKLGKSLDLEHPCSFNEKIQWLKLYGYKPEYDNYVDKYSVKDYIRNTIGDEYVVPTFGVWNSVEEIDWDKLPLKFVLKTTSGSGGNDVYLCKNKSTFDIEATKKKIANSLKRNTYWFGRERPYKKLKPRIMAEMLLEDSGADLRDYKFFCFDGKVKCFKIDFNRFVKHQANYYDVEGHLLPFGEVYCPPDFDKKLPLPQKLDEMVSIAEKISSNIPFLRVDLYETNDKIFFGEMTFYPASGYGKFIPDEWDIKLGEWLNI